MDFSDMLLDFNGRLRRRDWWLLGIGLGIFQFFVNQVVAPMVLGDDGRPQIAPGSFMPTYPIPLLVLMLAISAIMLWPTLALAVKRAHDRDKPASLVIILTLISTLASWGGLIDLATTGSMMTMGLAGLGNFVVGLYLLITLGFLDGTPGPNQYGASPKGYGGYSIDVADEFA